MITGYLYWNGWPVPAFYEEVRRIYPDPIIWMIKRNPCSALGAPVVTGIADLAAAIVIAHAEKEQADHGPAGSRTPQADIPRSRKTEAVDWILPQWTEPQSSGIVH